MADVVIKAIVQKAGVTFCSLLFEKNIYISVSLITSFAYPGN
jgi:hypothetical protein